MHNFNLSVHRNAFHPHLNAEHSLMPVGMSINEVLVGRDLLRDTPDGWVRVAPYVVMINGGYVLQKDWNVILDANDVVQIVHMPKGGGGGSGGGIIIGILGAVLAYFTFGVSLVGIAAMGAALAGGFLLGNLIPTPPSMNQGANPETSSSTYNLEAQGNRAKLNQAMPRVYGTMRTYPDLATKSYSEFESNQQMLYQLFCISLGEVDVDEIFLDETPITNFSDAQWEVIKPGGVVTLFPDNVIVSDAVNNIELVAPDSPDWRPPTAFVISNTIDIDSIAIDIQNPRGVGQIDKNPKGNGGTLALTVLVFAEYRNLNGGPWTSMDIPPITYATQTPQMRTYRVTVPLGKYEVRVQRVSGTPETGAFDMCTWIGLRGYASSTRVYGNCTLLATKMRATGALNSNTAKKLSTVSTGKISKWDPVNGWGPLVRTSNPCWAAADVLRNTDYGRGLPTSRMNIQNIYRLAGVADTRGDQFNGVFDVNTQLWEALKTVLRVMRSTPIYYAGNIDFIRDEPQTVVRANFTPGHMVKGSFTTTYSFVDDDSPDHIVVEYIEPSLGWKTDEVTCAFPDSPMRNPVKVAIKGITIRDQAAREGMSMAAANRDRRRSIQFTTLRPGLLPSYNSLVRINHDVPLWGYSGRILSFTPSNGRMRTTEPVPFNEPGTWLATFRKRDGTENGPYQILKWEDLNADNNEFGFIVVGTTAELSTIYISDGYREDLTFYTCGPSTRRGLLALTQSCKPTSDGQVQLTFINSADSVHYAENDMNVPPPEPESGLPGVDALPIVDSVDVVYTVEVGVQNIVAKVSRQASYYEFEARVQGGLWQRLGIQQDPMMPANLSPGPWEVRVRGVNRVEGPWTTWAGVIEATTLPVVKITSFTAGSELFCIPLHWTYDPNNLNIADSVEVRSGITNVFGDSQPLINLPYPANSYSHVGLGHGDRRYYWIRARDTAGRYGPWFNNGLALTSVTTSNADNILDAVDGQIGEEQLTHQLLEKINTPDVDLDPLWTAINDERTQRIEGDTAIASDVTETMAVANGAMAATQTNATSIAKTNGDLAAMYTIKTQMDVNGNPYIAAIGVGVENTGGVITSSITMMGDKLTFINPNNGSLQTLMQLTSEGLVVRSAFISKATITNALIGATLTSVATDGSGNPILSLDFQTGAIVSRAVSGGRRVERDNMGERIYDENGTLRMRMGMW